MTISRTEFEQIQLAVTRIETTVNSVDVAIRGEKGSGGLVTKTSNNTKSLIRVWWAIGILTGVFVTKVLYGFVL